MAIVANRNGSSTRRLLRAVGELSWEDFQDFIGRVLALKPVPPDVPRLSRRETTLLLKINAGPPAEWQRTYTRLIEKRRAGGPAEKTIVKVSGQDGTI